MLFHIFQTYFVYIRIRMPVRYSCVNNTMCNFSELVDYPQSVFIPKKKFFLSIKNHLLKKKISTHFEEKLLILLTEIVPFVYSLGNCGESWKPTDPQSDTYNFLSCILVPCCFISYSFEEMVWEPNLTNCV